MFGPISRSADCAVNKHDIDFLFLFLHMSNTLLVTTAVVLIAVDII